MESKNTSQRQNLIRILTSKVGYEHPFIDLDEVEELLHRESTWQLNQWSKDKDFVEEFLEESFDGEALQEAFVKKHAKYLAEFPLFIKRRGLDYVLNGRILTLKQAHDKVKEVIGDKKISSMRVFNHIAR